MSNCPNCGTVNSLDVDDHHRESRFFFHCDGCGLRTANYLTKAEALAAWQMPAARADERRKVLAEVRELITTCEERAALRSGMFFAEMLRDALDKMETGK